MVIVSDALNAMLGIEIEVLILTMEVGDWTSSSDDSETCALDINEEEYYYALNDAPKLQFRKELSKVHWNIELGMAEVVEMKGQMWKTSGIVRHGKIYCFIEEALYLSEIGALHLVDNDDTPLSLEDMYKMVVEGQAGCTWEAFEVYRHLKSLGYIVGRHGIPWSMKNIGSHSTNIGCKAGRTEALDKGFDEKILVTEVFHNLQLNELRPVFDVYCPNSKFKKSSPGDPHFLLYLTSGHPPSKQEIDYLERCYVGCPLKFCHVDHGRVSFFSLRRVELPVLP